MVFACTLPMRPAPITPKLIIPSSPSGSPGLGYQAAEALDLRRRDGDQVLGLGIGFGPDVFNKGAKRVNTNLLDTIKLARQIRILLGVARHMSVIGSQYVGAEEILAITARASPHGDEEELCVPGDFSRDVGRHHFDLDTEGARFLIKHAGLIDFHGAVRRLAHSPEAAGPAS